MHRTSRPVVIATTSEAERNILNSKVRFNLDDASKLTLVANAIQIPVHTGSAGTHARSG